MSTAETVESGPRMVSPVAVEIKNWSDYVVKPRLIKSTVFATYVVDGTDLNKKIIQICGYEPNRVRLVVQVVDHEVVITNENPGASPLTASPLVGYSAARYLPPQGANASNEYEFFGPDAFWLVACGSTGRVTVTKEYC